MKHLCTTLLLFTLLFYSCSDSDETPLSSEKKLLKFEVEGATTEIKDDIVYLYFPAQQKEFYLPVQLQVSENASVNITSGELYQLDVEDFTIRIQAQDGTSQEYRLEIILAEGLSSVLLETYDFLDGKPLANPSIITEGEIDEENKKITFKYSFTSVYGLRKGSFLKITYNGNKNYITVPNSEEVISFEHFNKLFIIDQGMEQGERYEVSFLNTDAYITEIELPLRNVFLKSSTAWIGSMSDFEYNKGLGRNDHIAFALENENVKNIKPIKITKTQNSTLSPNENQARDFTEDVEYIGTSEAGNQHKIIVRVIKKKLLTSPHSGSIKIENKRASFDYISISPIISGVLINKDTGVEYEMESFTNAKSIYKENATQGTFVTKDILPDNKDKYIPRVKLENGDVVNVDLYFHINF